MRGPQFKQHKGKYALPRQPVAPTYRNVGDRCIPCALRGMNSVVRQYPIDAIAVSRGGCV